MRKETKEEKELFKWWTFTFFGVVFIDSIFQAITPLKSLGVMGMIFVFGCFLLDMRRLKR